MAVVGSWRVMELDASKRLYQLLDCCSVRYKAVLFEHEVTINLLDDEL